MRKAFIILSIFIPALVLLGWCYDVHFLKYFFSPQTSMRVNSAIGLLFLGITLSQLKNKWALVFLSVPLVIGILTTFEYLLHIDLGIDQLIFLDPDSPKNWAPGRPALLTAIGLVLVSMGMIFRFWPVRMLRNFAHGLFITIWILAFQSMICFLEGFNSTNDTVIFTQMALHTSLVFGLITSVLLVEDKNIGIAPLILGNSPASRVFKILFAVSNLVPPFILLVRDFGVSNLWWSQEFGRVFNVTSNIVFFSYVVFQAGKYILRAETLENIAKNDLTQTMQVRDDFLTLASHALKTPLTSLKLQNQMMQKQKKFEDPKLHKFFVSTDRHIDRLNRLVEDMLDISRIDSGKLRLYPAPMDLMEVLRKSVHYTLVSMIDSTCPIELQDHGPIIGTWDKARLEQVFINLLSNACQYGDGTPVTIKLIPTKGGIRVWITNGGKGIEEKDLERIFKRFEISSNINESTGLGLGLFLSRSIIEQHRGNLIVESVVNHGATFKIWLPV